MTRPFRLIGCFSTFLLASIAIADVVPPDELKIQNRVVSKSLTGEPGDAAAGRMAFADRSLGNCLACHANAEMSDEQFHGEVGPALDGVADRWTAEQLRAIVANSKKIFGEQTIMPSFYSLDVGEHVREDLLGKTILTAQQVEDVVAYLTTLK